MHDAPFPESLSKYQAWFAKIITAPIEKFDSENIPVFPENLIPEIRKKIPKSPYLKSEERIGIYQKQYWQRLFKSLQEIFPTLVRLFNYEDFNCKIAEPYLSQYPPSDWLLSNLGNQLPLWLQTSYRGTDASLILEMALLDLAYQHLLFSELLPSLQPHQLSDCQTKKLFLQPSVLLFECQADLFAFRSQLMEQTVDHWQMHPFPSLKKSAGKKYFVLYRNQEQTSLEEINSFLFQLLSQFKMGTALIDLIPFLEGVEPFQISESFQKIAAKGWLSISASWE